MEQKGFWDKSLAAVIINRRLIIRAAITLATLGIIVYILRMLFFYKPSPEFKDLINVVIGAMLMSLSKVIDFWFKKDDEDHVEEKTEKVIEENDRPRF
jgi:hypothetical protein